MNDLIPLFSTCSSLKQGGIFTFEEKPKKTGPVSIIKFVKEEGMKEIGFIESDFESFMVINKFIKPICKTIFGLKLVICNDLNDKSELSWKTESKVIIILKDDDAYKILIKLFTKAATDGFYYYPRLDWKTLKEMWNKDGLMLCLPFYSSFLAVNTLTFNSIIPDLPENPIIFKEINGCLPFDSLLDKSVSNYASSNNLTIQPTKSIYYKNRNDAKSFLIWRTILNKSSWAKPEMEFMSSKEFCWESFKELKNV